MADLITLVRSKRQGYVEQEGRAPRVLLVPAILAVDFIAQCQRAEGILVVKRPLTGDRKRKTGPLSYYGMEIMLTDGNEFAVCCREDFASAW